jgi:hypothetical protein
MNKAKIIGQIRQRGERDLSISHAAWRLLCRVCSARYVDPKAKMEDSFPLPWSQVAVWLGNKDDKACARAIAELVDRNYLQRDGLYGCPAKVFFWLVSSCPKKGATDCPSRGATNCPQKGAHHISISFQEERLEERGQISSLRSKGTKGDGLAASPKVLLTDAQRLQHAHALSRLRGELTRTTKTGAAFEEKP